MVYQTTLKSLNPPRGANGEQLQFIGNFPCKVGDRVWTDGNVIFGHRSIRFTPPVPVSVGEVVPVFFADETQGYFDLRGKFHKKKLPVSSNFVNDANQYYQAGNQLLDLEIALDEKNKNEGYRYATSKSLYVNNDRSLKYDNLYIYKNSELETEYNLYENLYPKVLELIQDIIYENPSNYYFTYHYYNVFLDKSGDWHAIIHLNHCKRKQILALVGALWSATVDVNILHTVDACYYIKNGNIEQELFVSKGRSTNCSGVLIGNNNNEFLVQQMNQYALAFTASIPVTEIILPLQDDFRIRYNSIRLIETYGSGASIDEDGIPFGANMGERLKPLKDSMNTYFPFFTNKFDILDKDDKAVISVDFPVECAMPVNVPIVKLKNGTYLLSLQVYDSTTDAGKEYNGLYLYSKKGGLKKLLDGQSYNFRLRKMKLSKIGKSSS